MRVRENEETGRTADTQPARRRCSRCRMEFRTAAPPGMAGAEVEILRCPECGWRFWSDPHGGIGGRCAVGLLSEQRP